jgi:Protein of unknown function (DUF3108)
MLRPCATRRICSLLLVLVGAPATPFQSPATVPAIPRGRLEGPETLEYGVEWRLIRAGAARLSRTPHHSAAPGWQIDLHLESTGMVSKLFRVNDDYTAMLDLQFCALSTHMKAEEGNRRRETNVTFDRERGKSSYLERDLVKNSVILTKELDISSCVHDVIGALTRLRAMRLDPGQSTQLPVSDGKKLASARIEAQEREQVKTPLGTHKTIRYEVFLFNDVLYARKGRLFLWLTDDDRRLPVQIRVRLQFHIGTITLQLEKAG